MNKLVKSVKKGFTLVELVVVIAIIAILSAVSVGGYFIFIENAKKTELTSAKNEITTILKTYVNPSKVGEITLSYGATGFTAMNGTTPASQAEAEAAVKGAIDANYAATDKDEKEGYVSIYTIDTTKFAEVKFEEDGKDLIAKDTDKVKAAFTTTAAKVVKGIAFTIEEKTGKISTLYYISSYSQAIQFAL